MMIKRPKIKLQIAPTYDIYRDKKALQFNKLISLVLKKSNIKNRDEGKNAMTIDLLESIYKEAKNDDKLDKLEEELKNKYKDKDFDREYKKALVKLCSSIQIVTKKELETLAYSRVSAIKSYLVNEKAVSASRLVQGEMKVADKKEDELLKLDLTIEVK